MGRENRAEIRSRVCLILTESPCHDKKVRMTASRTYLSLFSGVMILTGTAFATELVDTAPSEALPELGRSTGLEIPRFVSLKAPRANVRRGPGKTFPIDWIFVRRDMPVEIIDEWELWRRIRDIDGARGWIHKQLLDGRRQAMVTELAELTDQPGTGGQIIAHLEGGVITRLIQCQLDWCQIKTGSYAGWLPKTVLWGVYAHETFN